MHRGTITERLKITLQNILFHRSWPVEWSSHPHPKWWIPVNHQVSRFMGSRSHPHRVLSVCVCVCVIRCLWVCVIEADSLQLRVITVGLYLFLSRSLLCQILAVFAVVVYGPFWFRDSWALLLPGLRSPDLGCPLLPCATRLSPTESSVSALRKAPLLLTEAPPLSYGKLRLVSRCVLLL